VADLPALGAPEDIYSQLKANGIVHGPHFQGLKALAGTADAIRATLRSGAETPAELEPTLLDAAVQAAVGFDPELSAQTVPYSVDIIEVRHPLPSECVTYLSAPKRLADGTRAGLDIDLCDPSGTTCVAMRGITARATSLVGQTHALVPVWRPSPVETTPHIGLEIRPTDLATDPGLAEKVMQSEGFTLVCGRVGHDATSERSLCQDVLRLLQDVLSQGGETRDLGIRLITSGATNVAPKGSLAPGASLHGLFGALAKEYPHWSITCVDCDDASDLARRVTGGSDIVLRSGQPFARSLGRIAPLPKAEPPYQSEHVYVVVGGAGGVGRIWTRHVLSSTNAQIVWLGRRPLDARIKALLADFATDTAQPIYIQADASDAQALRFARDEVLSKFNRIDGVVLSAIGLADASIARMSAAQLDLALTAKLDVSQNVFDAFGDHMSAFGLVFSSLQSFSRMAGQGNYAAGSTFADAAGHAQRAVGKPVTVVNWGFWADEGIVATQDHKDRQAQFGQLGLTPDRAMAALDWAITQRVPQLAIAELTPDATVSQEDPRLTVTISGVEPNALFDAAQIAPNDPRVENIFARVGPQMDRYDPHMAAVLQAAMAEVGLTGAEVALARAALPTFLDKWLAESLRVLNRECPRLMTFADALEAWDAAVADDRAHPDLGDHIALVDATLRALPQILAGRIPATDILFPEGRFDLVSGVYNGNIVADYFNDILCDALEAVVQAHIAKSPGKRLRLAEVGAGTGGTARKVFARLAPYVDHIESYLFTDLSKAFLINARQSFKDKAPYLDTAIFDASETPGTQGLDAASYDIVIATNVLHATADIVQSVTNAKALLRGGGLMLINELIQPSLFSHLTFGLLEGWWAYDDAALRMQGTPALNSAAWGTVLSACGFRNQRRLNPAAEVLGQQVFVGESDGVIVQGLDAAPAPAPKPERAAAVPTRVVAKTVVEMDKDALIAGLTQKIAQAIELPAAQIDPNTRFERYGVDSILILQVVSALRADFPSVTSTLLFEADTVAALADHFSAQSADDVAAFLGAVGAPPLADPPVPAPHVERQSAPSDQTADRREERSVAIIGMAGQFAGAPDLAAYWTNLSGGRSSISDGPTDGRAWTRASGQSAGYIDGVDRFDPLHFAISPAEAEKMDPQERLFLMAAYHAMEHAGYAPLQMSRQGPVGVFAAAMNAHYPTRAAFWSLANRLSYLFDFTGPSLAADTACSASLTALSMAVDALRAGRCRTAICGGVNVIAHPRHVETLDHIGIVSPSGQIRAFGAAADGMVSGEGVGVVVLKRLDHALADGDRIEAVIRGIALNSGGRTSSFTAPSPKAQAEVITQALSDACAAPSDLSLVEAHGTGTRLGDPVELEGLARALAGSDARISTVKPNIGHCESAAGFAGLFKLVLQMQHRQIVPSLGATPLNPEIDLAATGFSIPDQLLDWTSDQPRLAGLSSFGAGGANGHLILSEAPGPSAQSSEPGPQLLVLSARTSTQLRQLVERFVALEPQVDLAAAAQTLQLGRDQHAERLACICSTLDDWQSALHAWLDGGATTANCGSVRVPKPLSDSAASALWAARDLEALADLWTTGHDVNWSLLLSGDRSAPVPLPLYPFAQDSYWLAASEAEPVAAPNVAAPVPADDTVDLLRAEIAQLLKISPDVIDAEAPLEGYGLDSIMVLHLTERLETHFGDLPKTLFFEHRTLASLAAHLTGNHTRKPAAVVAPSKPSDIAIIGVAGRYPGAETLDQFWENLRAGRDSITEIPAERWDHAPFFATEKAKGKTRSKWGGFLSDVDAFDAPFFGMLPKDAELADPQERLFLQTSYHAIEQAGHRPDTLGDSVGVFVGVMYEEYQLLGVEETQRGTPTALSGSPASIANRVSYALDLTGPSMAVDTMCSSSLSAIHLAVRALQNGDCDAAVAGGVNLNLHPNKYLMMAHGGFEASDGKCRAFGADGDGYVPSEGVGAVVLRPLDAAERDGDPVLAVIKGTSINHGGRANGYTVPDPVAQGEVIADTLARAGVEPEQVSFVECHGTGTSLGDPIEIAGLRRGYGAGARALGSVKANIGHCESAAGIAGLTKILLQLQHGEIAPNIHATRQNPDLEIEGTGFEIPVTPMPWPSTGGPRLAGLSSFGGGGSNAHLVVHEAPAQEAPLGDPGEHILPLSAASEAQLAQLAHQMADHLEAHRPNLADVAYTLQTGRRVLKHRAVAMASSLDEAVTRLRGAALGPDQAPRDLPKDAQDWLEGRVPDWDALHGDAPRRRVALPGYPFAKHRYWGVPRPAEARNAPTAPTSLMPDPGLACFGVDWHPKPARPTRATAQTRMVINLTGAGLNQPADIEVIDLDPGKGPQDILADLVQRLGPVFGRAKAPAALQLVLARNAAPSLLHAACGFVGSLRAERRGLHGQVIQIDRDTSHLAEEARTDERFIRYDGKQRLSRVLVTQDMRPLPAFTPSGAVVIAGGAGGVGLHFARHFAGQQPGQRLVLLGRSAIDARIEGVLADLRSLGGAPSYHAVDIADEVALAGCLQEVRATRVKISAVIHAAGVLRDGLLMAKRPADARAVAAPKIDGVVALDRVTAQDPLEAFVLCSSLAGLSGNLGQSDYAFANGWQDGFAAERALRVKAGHSQGQSVSIIWPLWADGGMTVPDSAARAMDAQFGLQAMPTKAGLFALNAALLQGATQLVVGYGRAEKIRETLDDGSANPAPLSPVSPPEPRPADAVLTQLRALVAEILRVAPEALDVHEPLADLGFDSIAFTELAAQCSDILGAQIDPSLFYSNTTLAEVSAAIAGDVAQQETALAAPPLQQPELRPEPRTNSGRDEIAIVGMSGAFPGAPSIDHLWQNLLSAREVITEIPADRWDWRAIWGDPKSEPGKSDIKFGGFLDDLSQFDPLFFGISPREAALMDPHQRLLMTHVWRALEDAAIAPTALAGSSTAVYLATSPSDYADMAREDGLILQQMSPSSMVGSISPNRISAYLDLHGPSEPVETACSSGLVALHRAVEAIRNGCEGAIVGATNTMMMPYAHVSFARSAMLSPEGQCRTFDASANGYVRSEAVCALVLKPLSVAQSLGLPIYGVIRGSGVNHSGKSSSLFAPNAKAQQALIEQVWREAGVTPQDVSAIEMHGTGTAVGDPIEFAGIAKAVESFDAADARIALSSVKSHLGHAEVAAGLVGLIKMLLQMRHDRLIPDRHRTEVNPAIQLTGTPFHLVDQMQTWASEVPRVAGVSSFGFGGVNAHVVVADAPAPLAVASPATEGPEVFVLSAQSANALETSARTLLGWIETNPNMSTQSLAATLQLGRAPLRHRLALIASSVAAFVDALRAWLAKDASPVATAAIRAEKPGDPLGDASPDQMAAAFIAGKALDWTAWRRATGRTLPPLLRLPATAMELRRCWYKDAPNKATPATAPARLIDHGTKTADGWRFALTFGADAVFLTEHVVQGRAILPATATIEIARAAAVEITGADQIEVTGLTFRAMVTPEDVSGGLYLSVSQVGSGHSFCLENGSGKSFSSGAFCAFNDPVVPPDPPIDRGGSHVQGAQFYQAFREMGIEYGPSFRLIQTAELAKGRVQAALSQPLPPDALGARLPLPPNMLDAALQTTLGLVLEEGPLPTSVPVYLERIRVAAPLPRDVLVDVADCGHSSDIRITDAGGAVLVDMVGLKAAPVPEGSRHSQVPVRVEPVANKASADLVQALKDMIAELTDVSPSDITSDAEFSDFGLTSINFAEMGARLHSLTGAEIAPTLFYESPSVDSLAARLGSTTVEEAAIVAAPNPDILKQVMGDISALIAVPQTDLDPDACMSDFGFDSLLYAELGSRLSARFGVEITPALFYGTETIADLCAALVADFGVVAALPTRRDVRTDERPPQIPSDPDPVQPSARDIAIIGMSGAFPGADSIAAFWENLVTGRDVISRPPDWRWDWRAHDGDPRVEPGKTNVHWGGFTDSVAEFDPELFGMSPTEAELTDPQQRLMMTHSWAALENAGYAPRSLSGSKTGLYMGTSNSSYCRNVEARGGTLDPRWVTGNVASIGPSRISHMLNLQGPSEPFETACSSSLVALHRAVEDLKAGYTDLALAGGVNVIPNVDMHVAFAAAGMLSPDGRCKTFDASANGYVRGEGVGVVVLKRMGDALRDGDDVLAVIKASGVAHAGRAASLTAPNPTSQATLIADVIQRAGVDIHDITCWEAHGTGTALGDPIEIEGLRAAFKARGGDDVQDYCSIGTAKSHVGHLEVAAGVAGLIKAVLQMQHRKIAANLNFETLNPAIKLENSPFNLALTTRDWRPAPGAQLCAGISSFGFGGVNASVVIQEAPAQNATPETEREVILVSARSAEALKVQAKGLADHLDKLPDEAGMLARVAHTLQIGREAMPHRLAFTAQSVSDAAARLRNAPAGATHVTGSATLSAADAALLQARWVAERDLEAACDAWRNGVNVDWSQFRIDLPRRIALPGTSFARDRYWISPTGPEVAEEQTAPQPAMEPDSAEHAVLTLTATFLGVPVDDIDTGAGIGDLGIDSIGLMTIVSRLQAQMPMLKAVVGLGERMLQVQTLEALQKLVDTAVEPKDGRSQEDTTQRVHLDLYAASQKSDPVNLLIARPKVGLGKSARAEADLIVNESHPLFFDHPLDHVSGLHLAEAISQLVRADALCRSGADPRDPVFLRRLKFEFPNFCQKAATQITAQRLSAAAGHDYRGEAVQNGKTVALGRLAVGDVPVGFTPPEPGPAGRRVARQRVNKHHAENVLLSNLKYDGMAATAQLSVAKAAGFYNDFNGPWRDSIVLLEAVRQLMRSFATRSAGKVGDAGGVAFLRDLDLRLDRPVYASETVCFNASADDSIAVGGAALLIVSGQVVEAISGQEIGQFSTSAATIPQHLKDAWEGQRALPHAEEDSP
jgi:acyl transferase domain-containing protein/aryl carrier-like protein/NADP-dependent 3-hydroxy acid dehydrogenase YdfG/ubiquinone/menaquinone biosynthesis C-methylase UbiE